MEVGHHKTPNDSVSGGVHVHKKVGHSTYKILLLMKNGAYARSVSRQLNLPESTTKNQIYRLLKLGLIEKGIKTSAQFYKTNMHGLEYISRYGVQLHGYRRRIEGKGRIHRLNLRCKIAKDNKNARFKQVNEKFLNWMPEYDRKNFPIGITFLRTPQTIILQFHEFETEKRTYLTDFFSYVLKGCFFAFRYLKDTYGIEIDIPERVTDQHLVNEAPEQDGKLDKRLTVEKELGRKARSLIETNMDGKAWIDRSKGMPEIETNDLLYEELLLSMPETVSRLGADIAPILKDLTEQVKIHLIATRGWAKMTRENRNAIRELRDAIREMRK